MSELINEACSTGTAKVLNIGGKDQCFEGLKKTAWLAKESFSFATIEAMRTSAALLTAIQNKDIIPLPYLENPEANNTEPQVKNGAWRDYTLKEGVPGVTHRIDTAVCTHAALKSYQNSAYSGRIFEVTDKNEILCDIQEDGTVKGRKMTSFSVGLRNERTADDVPFTNISIKFENDTPSVVKANYDASEVEGIYDVELEFVSATATAIKLKAKTHCAGTYIDSFELTNILVKDDEGATVTPLSLTAPTTDNTYTITGTGFETGYTVELNGVVLVGGKHFESVEPISITV